MNDQPVTPPPDWHAIQAWVSAPLAVGFVISLVVLLAAVLYVGYSLVRAGTKEADPASKER